MSQGFAPPPYGAPQFQQPQFQQPQVQQQQFGSPPTAVWTPATGPALPTPPPNASPPGARPPQRPAVIALACTLAVVASLQWICALSLLWVAAAVGTSTFDQVGDNGALFHILSRFDSRLLNGLAVPLYAFPLASLVTGFLVLSRRPWTRVAHTVVGALALGWAAWWLRADPLWWFSGGWYVVVACLVLWTPAASAWYRWRAEADLAPGSGRG